MTAPKNIVIKYNPDRLMAKLVIGDPNHSHLAERQLTLKPLENRFGAYQDGADKYSYKALRYTIADSGEMMILAWPIATVKTQKPAGQSASVKFMGWFLATDFDGIN